MTHEDIKILISAYNDGEVTLDEKTIVEQHLRTCTECQKDLNRYKAMSSSLSKWPNEALSPDETMKMQNRFQQRRDSMFAFNQRNMMAAGTTLAIMIVVGSVFQIYLNHPIGMMTKNTAQGYLKQDTTDYRDNYTAEMAKSPYQFKNNALQNVFVTQQRIRVDADTPYQAAAGAFTYNRVLGSTDSVLKDQFSGYANLATPQSKTGGAMMGLRASSILGNQILEKQAETPVEQEQAPINEDRRIIKNADITLLVDNAEKTQSDLESMINKFNGVVITFTLNKLYDGSHRGYAAFKVLPDDLDNILHELRSFGEVQTENQSGTDITNHYVYLQKRLKNDRELRERLKKILAKNANNVDNNLNIENQIASTEARINANENRLNSMDEKSYLATVIVNFYDTVKPAKTPNYKEQLGSKFKDSLKNTVKACYEIALSSFNAMAIIFTFLAQIAIWGLIFWGIYYVVSKFFKK